MASSASDPKVLRVGDSAIVEGQGVRPIERIAIALQPSIDPAAETHFVEVEEVERGEHGPPFVVSLEGGTWAYGLQVQGVVNE